MPDSDCTQHKPPAWTIPACPLPVRTLRELRERASGPHAFAPHLRDPRVQVAPALALGDKPHAGLTDPDSGRNPRIRPSSRASNFTSRSSSWSLRFMRTSGFVPAVMPPRRRESPLRLSSPRGRSLRQAQGLRRCRPFDPPQADSGRAFRIPPLGFAQANQSATCAP